ncbi:LOW QUALITY PROTEIN: hypothetical protein HZS_8098 [Henneguya salminicola]|nr:LOW QUALITY PROTEIN: hypothetical protein HZS_8098 [Henneguya salminicola]
MMSKYSEKSIIKPTREAIVYLVSNTQRDQGCGDIYRQSPLYASVSDCNPRLFLKNIFTYEMKTRNGFPYLYRLLLWSHPDLMPYLRYRRVLAYLDAKFRSVSKPFKQCIILMVYNHATELYIPVVYALVDNKKAWTYWHFLHIQEDLIITNRTNNGLENFNKKINSLIKELSEEYCRLSTAILSGECNRPKRTFWVGL